MDCAMDQVPVSSSFVRMCQTLHSEHLSHSHSHSLTHSQLRLGTVLKLMDICACLSIEHLSRTSCVTASMDHLVFSNECVTAGEALNIEASVVRCFNSSAEVVCRVVIDPAMSLHSHSQSKSRGVRCLAHAFFVFVRLDRGKMPGVFPETKAEVQAFELAMERRKARQYKHAQSSEDTRDVEDIRSSSSDLNCVAAGESLLQFTHIVLPPHANHMGNTFGGQILQWAEEAAVMSATMHVNASKSVNNNVFQYFDTTYGFSGAESFEKSGLTAVTSNPNLVLSTVYVNGMSFLQPSSVGDRITFKSQVCRTFGSVIEVEVLVTAYDVGQSSERHINTGHFAISCKEAATGLDIFISPVLATTVEQKDRYNMSLKRMMIASIRSASNTTSLENPYAVNEYSTQSSFIQLSSMLRMQESSIWNSELPSSLTLSPLFEVECASEFALQDVSSLVVTLRSSDSWDRVPLQMQGTSLHIKNREKGVKIVLLKFTVEIRAKLDRVAAYALDLTKRCEWDTILHTCRVVKNVVENEIDIVYMATHATEEKRGVDYCLLRCHRTLDDGRVVIASRSIVYDGCEHDKKLFTRGELMPSGFVLTSISNESDSPMHCVRMDYLLQLDGTSAELLSGDCKGHTSRILTSMSKLKSNLEKKS